MKNVFEDYANYYNLLYKDKNYKQETQYILDLLKRVSINEVKTILELGSGTGRHAILMGHQGLRVTGVERSQEMLKIAQLSLPQTLKDKVQFIQGDATSFEDKNLYDACLSLFHVVSYQISNNDVSRIMTTASKHLKTNGFFIFDIWYGPAVLWIRPETRIQKFIDGDRSLTRLASSELLDHENVVDVHYTLYFEEKNINGISKVNEMHKMRYFFLLELKQFLANSGLCFVHAEEWLTGNKPSQDTWGVTIVAKKV